MLKNEKSDEKSHFYCIFLNISFQKDSILNKIFHFNHVGTIHYLPSTNHLRILAIGSSLLTLDIVNANFTLLSLNRRLINSLAMSYRLAPTNRLASSR